MTHQSNADDREARAMPQRVSVIGTTGSGKTTLSKRIAAAIGVPHIELDALHWDANWTEATADVFQARVSDAITVPRWVVDGNYSGKLGMMVYDRADTVVWMDYPFPLVIWRLLARTIRRTASREVLWNGNQERFKDQFLSRESLFVWAVKSHWRHRRTYSERFSRPELAHLRVLRLKNPRDAARYVRALESLAEHT